MMEVVNLVSLFPTPSDGAKYTPDLTTFHNFLQVPFQTKDCDIKKLAKAIAKGLSTSSDGKVRKDMPRRLPKLIQQCLLQKNINHKTSLLPSVALAILRFKQTQISRNSDDKPVFEYG